MKKIYYNSVVAKVLLCLSVCNTITIGPIVLTTRKELSMETIRHESTHAVQWCEYTSVAAFIYLFAIWALNAPLWGALLVPLVLYAIYCIEWLVRLCFALIKRELFRSAYKSISFEREARANEQDSDYLEKRNYFANLKHLQPWR